MTKALVSLVALGTLATAALPAAAAPRYGYAHGYHGRYYGHPGWRGGFGITVGAPVYTEPVYVEPGYGPVYYGPGWYHGYRHGWHGRFYRR